MTFCETESEDFDNCNIKSFKTKRNENLFVAHTQGPRSKGVLTVFELINNYSDKSEYDDVLKNIRTPL